MKFSCEKALLSAAVATTSRAVAVKSSIPAMEGILIEADTRLPSHRLQPGDRDPSHRARGDPGTRLSGALCPPVRRDHSENAG